MELPVITVDPAAFREGIKRACADMGCPGSWGFVEKLAEFGAAGYGLGEGFEKGAQSFLSKLRGKDREPEYEMVRKKSLLRRLLPWALAAGGGALALQYGNAWGRHAAATGNDRGPIKGTAKAILEAATGHKFKYVGKGNIAPKDEYHSPMYNDEYNNLVTYGDKNGPSFYDRISERPSMPGA